MKRLYGVTLTAGMDDISSLKQLLHSVINELDDYIDRGVTSGHTGNFHIEIMVTPEQTLEQYEIDLKAYVGKS